MLWMYTLEINLHLCDFLLSQECTGQRPVHDWFLEIAFVHNIGMHVCVSVSTPEGIHVNEPRMTDWKSSNHF